MDNVSVDRDSVFDASFEKITESLEKKQYFKARDELLKYNEADIAEFLEDVGKDSGIEAAIILFRLLPKDISVEVFPEIHQDYQVDIIGGITHSEIEYILQELDFDDKIDILEELPANIVDKILEKTPKSERNMINTFLNYPESCAGSLMTPDYISLQKEWSVEQALEHIRREGMDAETIYTCYVKDSGRKLIGIVSLSSLVVEDKKTRIKEIMRTDFVCENVYEDQEEIAADFKKYGFLAMPVVDNEFRLVGIITFDDILDVIEEEVTEDMERMVGVLDFDNSGQRYLDMPILKHVVNRLPWLMILMVAYVFTGMIITRFESNLSKVMSLIAYMPLLMGTGGNTGSQAATLIIRGIATDEVEPSDFLKILWKETRIGFLIGILLSALNFFRVYWLDDNGFMVSFTVCASMLVIVMFAKIIGSMIPLIVKSLRLDPALIANPAISSVSDAVALGIYFMMARLFLNL